MLNKVHRNGNIPMGLESYRVYQNKLLGHCYQFPKNIYLNLFYLKVFFPLCWATERYIGKFKRNV